MASRTNKAGSKRQARSAPGRSRLVWGALLGSMTVLGGALTVLQGTTRIGSTGGVSLLPMVSAMGPRDRSSIAPRVPLEPGRWTSIVIHHSGSLAGTPATLDEEHRSRGLAGLGYHFVIGNGSGMDDGEVHAGARWLDQLPGAHVGGALSDRWNRESIGICLIGDGRRRAFTDQQLAQVVALVSALARDLKIPQDRVYLHRDLTATDDPGRFFPEALFRAELAGR